MLDDLEFDELMALLEIIEQLPLDMTDLEVPE